ncbi:hypothetical protein HID58_055022, partial [Brassica napus]
MQSPSYEEAWNEPHICCVLRDIRCWKTWKRTLK